MGVITFAIQKCIQTIPALCPIQVVTIAVYSFTCVSLLGAQLPALGEHQVDLYVPVLSLLQFGFYIGWLRYV